jgi:hypothetical protein
MRVIQDNDSFLYKNVLEIVLNQIRLILSKKRTYNPATIFFFIFNLFSISSHL